MKYYGGIDLGGTNTKIGLLDENANLIFSTSIKTLSSTGVEDTVRRISEKFLELVSENKINYDDIVAVGVGIPAPAVDKRYCGYCANLPWEANTDVAKLFEDKLNKKVYIDNDVNVIALGETFAGASKGFENVLCVAIGTGIGAGLIANGRVVSGSKGAAGEIGHIVLEEDGFKCGCGLSGCFETLASATGLERLAKIKLENDSESALNEIAKTREIEAKDIFDMAKKGDKLALELVEDEAKYLAKGLGIALNLYNPEILVLGGGVSLAGDFLFDRVKKHLDKYALKLCTNNLIFKTAILDNDAGIYGGAYLAMTEER